MYLAKEVFVIYSMNIKQARKGRQFMNNVYVRLMIYLYTSEKTSADYAIAKVLISQYDQFPDILIEDIAKKANATAATVTKFAHKLGYKSFKELRYDIYEMETHPTIDQLMELAKTDVYLANKAYFHNEQEKFVYYQDCHTTTIIEKIAMYFNKSKSIGICYPPYAYSCVHVLRNYLTPLHKEVEGVMREVNSSFLIERMQLCDVIILISLQGTWVKENIEVCKQWKQQGKKIVLITAIYEEDFYEIPDVIVPFQFIGETIMDTSYQISTLFIKAAFACANFPKVEKNES